MPKYIYDRSRAFRLRVFGAIGLLGLFLTAVAVVSLLTGCSPCPLGDCELWNSLPGWKQNNVLIVLEMDRCLQLGDQSLINECWRW